LVGVLFVAAALFGLGAFASTWRRDLAAALAGVPLMLAGAGTAFIGVTRFATPSGGPVIGQEAAVLLAVAALGAVALGLGLAGREGSR
jgi:NADH:ubiquinone oxidoreductase subunit K